MFDNIKPIDPRAERRRRQVIIIAAFAAMLAGYLYYEYKNYPEERTVNHFFEALKNQDYRKAYEIWKPSSSYTFKDFSQDWGPNGAVQDRVIQFHITGSTERGSGVVVRVRVNGKDDLSLWVEKKDKSLSFPP